MTLECRKNLKLPALIRMWALALTAATAVSSCSVSAGEERQSRKHRGPPPEALEACADQAVDAACSFNGRRGEVEGTCIVPRDSENQLACAPEGGPKHKQRAEKDESEG